MAQVYLGNRMLVDGVTGNQLKVGGYRDPANPSQPDPGNPYYQVQWDDKTEPPSAVAISDGKLKGLIDLRDSKLPEYEKQLDVIARKVMAAVNAVHAGGYGLDDTAQTPPGAQRVFFTGSGAKDMAVNAAIAADPRKIAASGVAGSTGNGDNALRIAGILKGTIPSGVTVTYTDLDGTTRTLTSANDDRRENGLVAIARLRAELKANLGVHPT
jgi:flagellar hook-associated protein 1 FlgK